MLIFAFVVLGPLAFSQEAEEAISNDNSVTSRPAEKDLLFDTGADTADEEQAGTEESAQEDLPGIGFGDFLRMILVLGIVIILIYGFFWVLKRYSGVKAEGLDAIRILSTRPVKGDTALHLIKTGKRIFLVGSSSSSVNLLSEIDDKESIDQIELEASSLTKPAAGGFGRMFRNRLGSGPVHSFFSANNLKEKSSEDPAEYLRIQRERLRDL